MRAAGYLPALGLFLLISLPSAVWAFEPGAEGVGGGAGMVRATDGGPEPITPEGTDDFMAFLVLSGVFIIIGGIAGTFIRRDISKRNMNMTKWMALHILFVIIVPVILIYTILIYDLKTFYAFFSLLISYALSFAPYYYVRLHSVPVVEQVPAEFMVKLSPIYKDVLTFGIVALGLAFIIIGLYQINTGYTDTGKFIIPSGILISVVGLIFIKRWFSMDRIVVTTREMRITRGKLLKRINWKDVDKLVFYKEISPLFILDLAGYRKKMGTKGAQRAVEVVAEDKVLKFKDYEIPSEADFRILFFILLYYRSISNPDSKVEFHAKWAKEWYREYRRHIIKTGHGNPSVLL